MDLQFYLRRTPDEDSRGRLREQYRLAATEGAIRCADCGQVRAITLAYRCLYCGAWFCMACAEVHFGKTVAEYDATKQAQPL